MANITLKEADILELIARKPHTIREISEVLKLDYGNTHRSCKKLYHLGQVHLDPPPGKSKKGSPVIVSMTINHRADDVIYSVLKKIFSRGGRVSLKDYYALLKNEKTYFEDLDGRGKMNNLLYLEFLSGYLKKEIALTKEGKKFLKDHGKKYDQKKKLKNKIERMISEKSLNNDSDKISH